ncbi:replication initiation and membrane attachment protein, DnaB2 [Candidatus Mycoplasma haematolamae str. Purdue]|uniref:Replication initiation and membrane attachment protein, DnaB2 n=1 Tax=Mycoplasma haematolamae (strain Purdue) TaxID=1212765 RepID=I7CH58_MYCHA|nr:hypothetical protein [Candidatus Mycoplasma haematolamae]AFO52501.1 replication initiation and membrane attachment protein, DnaB2 [Candidatus Mycoplasma haematolamae str. Purdue]
MKGTNPISTNWSSPKKFIQIELELSSFDWISYHQIYPFLLSQTSLILFPYLHTQSRLNELNSTKKYSLSNLLSAKGLDYPSFRSSLAELEKFKLVSIFSSSEDTLTLRLSTPLPIRELIGKLGSSNIPDFKLSEWKYSIERYSSLEELTFLPKTEGPKEYREIQLEGLSNDHQQLYWAYYDELFKSFGREFSLSREIIDLIEKYWVSEKISSSKLMNLSLMALRLDSEGKHFLSITELSRLIDSELGLIANEVNEEDYLLFWRNLLNKRDRRELKKQFKALFSSHSEITFYLKLTKKVQAPATLENWVKDCKNKKFSQAIINGILSFVYSLLKKIPVNYLIKMSESLVNDGIKSSDQFLQHIKEILKYELANKNRLGITQQELTV